MIGFTFMVETVEESDRIFFEDLYKKYNRLMFSIANRYCSKLCDCEDIVQDSVVNLCSKVKLLRDLPSYALPSYMPWRLSFRGQRMLAVPSFLTQKQG